MFSAVGLSHKTAPLEVREQAAISETEIPRVLVRLAEEPGINEVVLLSTCNRTEAYLITQDRPPVRRVVAALCAARNVPEESLLAHVSVLTSEEAVHHTLRVAAGLESMIVGEPQILGQVRRAFTTARGAGTAGPILNRLMQVAIGCGRCVRTETGLGRRATSVPQAAMSHARRLLGGLEGRRVVLVGVGEMAELVAKVFTHAGARLAVVANRTVETARLLAARYGAIGTGLDGLRDELHEADLLVVSIGAEHPVLDLSDFSGADSRSAPLLVIDIGVPRGVAAQARTLRHVMLYDLDELAPAGSGEVSTDDLARASIIVQDALDVFMRWLGGRAAVPVIAALHRRAEWIIDEELSRARGRLRGLDENQRRAVRGVVEGALRKLLHAPFVRLRAQGEDARVLTLARELFDLDGETGEGGS